MNVIRIYNDFSFFDTSDSELRDKLYGYLRFPQRNYYFTTLYKQKVWDGYINFFNRLNGRFLTGLLPEVQRCLKHLAVPYELDDQRKPIEWLHKEIGPDFLNQWLPKGMKPIVLQDYQVDLVNQAISHGRGIIEAPTSSGKTYIMLAIMKCLPPGTPILFLANRKGIVQQNYKEIIKWGFEKVGRFDGNHHEPNVITCATVQSLHHIDRLLPKFRAVIVDEIHMMMGATAVKTYKKLTGCYTRIAVSATPFKFSQKAEGKEERTAGDEVHKYSVKGYFGAVFKTKVTESGSLTTTYLQARGRLSQSRCTFYPITEPQIPFDIYIDAVTNGIAQSWHFHQVVAKLVQGLQGRTLILVERLAHGDTLQQLIPGSLWVRGKDNDATRDQVIQQLQQATGNVVAIATQGIFNAAINVFVHNLINAAGGKAEHDIIQRMGRGLRTADDKEICNYFDFLFNINPYLEEHSKKRLKILKKEGHEIIVKDKLDFL